MISMKIIIFILLSQSYSQQGPARSGQVRCLGPDPVRAGPAHQKSDPTLDGSALGPMGPGPALGQCMNIWVISNVDFPSRGGPLSNGLENIFRDTEIGIKCSTTSVQTVPHRSDWEWKRVSFQTMHVMGVYGFPPWRGENKHHVFGLYVWCRDGAVVPGWQCPEELREYWNLGRKNLLYGMASNIKPCCLRSTKCPVW